jgi:hypothetical protein
MGHPAAACISWKSATSSAGRAILDRDQRLGDRAAERVAGAEQDDPVGRIFRTATWIARVKSIGFEDLGDEGVISTRIAQGRGAAGEGPPDMAAAVDHRHVGRAEPVRRKLASARSDEPCISGVWNGP